VSLSILFVRRGIAPELTFPHRKINSIFFWPK
jgi:hypothetical protein